MVVAVNLSNVQFIHDNLLGCVDDALAESGLEPQFLDLEITEGMIMSGDAATIATVDALRQRGVQLTVDDFGTGYSSLSALRRYPLSKLKIDRSFIDDITREPDDAAIIPAIIAVARSLKLRVIAEGRRDGRAAALPAAARLRRVPGLLRQHGLERPGPYTPASIRPVATSNRRMRASTWPWSDACGSPSTRWSFR